MKTVAIPIENKVREFDGKLWLGLNLVKRNYRIVLGPSYEIKSTIDLTEPDVYFAKDTSDGNIPFFKKLQESGIIVCGLSPESAVNSEVEQYAQHKSEVMNIFNTYFSWGEEPAKAVRSRYTNTEINIKVTGNPRFDLLTKQLKDIYQDGGDEIQQEYGDYILVNTNFGMGNAKNRESTFNLVRENYPERDPYHEAKISSRIMYSFLELIIYLSSIDLDHNIVVRPHPGEDHSTYRKAFNNYDDVYVKHEGDVRTWIYGSDGVIHYDCTTGIEAALMGTPVLSYQPLSDQRSDKVLAQVVSQTATMRHEVEEWIIESATSDNEYTLNTEQKSAVKRYFPNIDRLATPLICNTVDSLTNESNGYSNYDVDLKGKIERYIKHSPVGPQVLALYDQLRDVQTDGKHQRSRKKQRQKFPGLSYKEMAERSRVISKKLELKDYIIENVPNTRHSYIITPK